MGPAGNSEPLNHDRYTNAEVLTTMPCLGRKWLDQGDGTSLVTARSTVDISRLGVEARYVRLHFREVGGGG